MIQVRADKRMLPAMSVSVHPINEEKKSPKLMEKLRTPEGAAAVVAAARCVVPTDYFAMASLMASAATRQESQSPADVGAGGRVVAHHAADELACSVEARNDLEIG